MALNSNRGSSPSVHAAPPCCTSTEPKRSLASVVDLAAAETMLQGGERGGRWTKLHMQYTAGTRSCCGGL